MPNAIAEKVVIGNEMNATIDIARPNEITERI